MFLSIIVLQRLLRISFGMDDLYMVTIKIDGRALTSYPNHLIMGGSCCGRVFNRMVAEEKLDS